ncbi:MAG: 4Fe-4S binding protein [Chloroflexota bacterium]|nr:4Fe-4S binding protein [Chloroflexota bacterium]
MFGTNIFKGLWITFAHWAYTYWQDIQSLLGNDWEPSGLLSSGRVEDDTFGYVTVQYPEKRLQTPERFRFMPMLIYEQEDGDIRCTACGICAKVCPPQCIWIVQSKDASGKTIPQCSEFYIDTSICMQCGFCAEYCPFDAIKMNHDYELSSYERHESWVYDMQELLVSTEYYANTHPNDWAREEAARAAKEAEKAAVR